MKKPGLNTDLLKKINPLGLQARRLPPGGHRVTPPPRGESNAAGLQTPKEEGLEFLLDEELSKPQTSLLSTPPPRLREQTPAPFFADEMKKPKSSIREDTLHPEADPMQSPLLAARRQQESALKVLGGYLNPSDAVETEKMQTRIPGLIGQSWFTEFSNDARDETSANPYANSSYCGDSAVKRNPMSLPDESMELLFSFSTEHVFTGIEWERFEKMCKEALGPFARKIVDNSLEQMGFSRATFPRKELENFLAKLVTFLKMEKRALFINQAYKILKKDTHQAVS